MITSKPESVGLSGERLERINDLTQGYIDRGDVAGTITMVARRNQIVHFQCNGLMDLESSKPMQEDAIFRIYSMTKPITAVAAMILYERGFFQLDTPVSTFIPAFKDLEVFDGGTPEDYKTVKAKREMTIGHLLTQTSGLTYDFINRKDIGPIYKNAGVEVFKDYAHQLTLKDHVDRLSKLPLVFSPGDKWNYSTAMEVVGYLIEVISGLKLNEFLRKEIFDPLGMVDTDFYVPEEKKERLSSYYLAPGRDVYKFISSHKNFKHNPGTLSKIPDLEDRNKKPTLLRGGDGLLSTVSDYYKFASTLLNNGRFSQGNLLGRKTIELMTMNHLPGDLVSSSFAPLRGMTRPGIGFGLGFAIMLDPAKANILGSPGAYDWPGGAHTIWFNDPKEELTAILMTQVFPAGLYNIEREFKTAVYQSIIG